MPSPEQRMPSPEQRMPSLEQRMPSLEQRVPSPWQRSPSPDIQRSISPSATRTARSDADPTPPEPAWTRRPQASGWPRQIAAQDAGFIALGSRYVAPPMYGGQQQWLPQPSISPPNPTGALPVMFPRPMGPRRPPLQQAPPLQQVPPPHLHAQQGQRALCAPLALQPRFQVDPDGAWPPAVYYTADPRGLVVSRPTSQQRKRYHG